MRINNFTEWIHKSCIIIVVLKILWSIRIVIMANQVLIFNKKKYLTPLQQAGEAEFVKTRVCHGLVVNVTQTYWTRVFGIRRWPTIKTPRSLLLFLSSCIKGQLKLDKDVSCQWHQICQREAKKKGKKHAMLGKLK